MKKMFDEDDLFRIMRAGRDCVFGAFVADLITRRFRSMHLMSSKLIADCVTANLVLNADITPRSADGIITCVRKQNRSLYTTVNSAYFPIEQRFNEYAKTVLGDNYDNIKKLDIRPTNYIVYVLSLDMKNNCKADSYEVILRTFSYDELHERGYI